MSGDARTSHRSRTDPCARRKIRLLLVNPRFPESFWSFRWALEKVLPDKRALNPPLGLATVAALCPSHWEVRIVDENVEPVPLEPEADVVGVCGMAVQFGRQQELLAYYRQQGYFVVAGGSYASLCPERYDRLADSVIAGESEYIWPRFCDDFERAVPLPLYHETGVVDLSHSPAPRFDLLKLDQYTSVSMQFSRGCPYRCDFCDIIVMFGRKPRTKNVEQIGKELDVLRAHGVSSVFFVDDNLIGNKKVAKSLLRFLIDYQRANNYAFHFGTEASLNIAEDDELLELFREANFTWVFIGIESPDEDSLKETHKTQNTRGDILSSVQTIYRNGIDVLAGFIVGFDNDTLETFDRQYRFITASGIQVAMVGLLTALPRTPLYRRLEEEGRLIPDRDSGDNTKPRTNLLPKQMGYNEMIRGYEVLYRKLFSDANIEQRIRNKIRFLRSPVCGSGYSLGCALTILRRLFRNGLLQGGPVRIFRFLRTFTTSRPRLWPQVVSDWIAGLAMKNYVERHFRMDHPREWQLVQSTAALLRRLCDNGIRRGTLKVAAQSSNGNAGLLVSLRGYVDRKFYGRAARRMEKLLRRSAATVTLCIEECCEEQGKQLDTLLRRLEPYGDRVSVWVSERVRPWVHVDSSVFHVLLIAPPTEAPAAK